MGFHAQVLVMQAVKNPINSNRLDINNRLRAEIFWVFKAL